MARTYRNIIYRPHGPKWMRKPRYKWKLLAGMPVHSNKVITDWDDKSISALREMKHRI